jgi:hypothetical protein
MSGENEAIKEADFSKPTSSMKLCKECQRCRTLNLVQIGSDLREVNK